MLMVFIFAWTPCTYCLLNTSLYDILSYIHLLNWKSKIQNSSNHFELKVVLETRDFVHHRWRLSLKFFDLLIICLDGVLTVSRVLLLSDALHGAVVEVVRAVKVAQVVVLDGHAVVGHHLGVEVVLDPGQLEHFLETLGCVEVVVEELIYDAHLFEHLTRF